jgi:hypothetical protein
VAKRGIPIPPAANPRGLTEDEWYRRRILAISTEMLASRVLRGEVDADNDDELRAAAKQCVDDARAAVNAALEFISG